MKIIDKDGRLFGKISIIDLAVLIIVAAIAIGFVVKQKNPAAGGSDLQPITFTVHTVAIPPYFADAIQIGDNIYDKDHESGGPIGVITDIQPLKSEKIGVLSDGTEAMLPAPDYIRLAITIEGKGIVSADGYLFNRIYAVGVNSNRNYYTRYALFQAVVSEVS